MDEIRIGIFGVGHRGLGWLRLMDRLDGYRIVAVGDIFEPLNERALAQLRTVAACLHTSITRTCLATRTSTPSL